MGKKIIEKITIGCGAGQAVVQIAEERSSREQYAIKLFLSRSAFNQEKSLYEDSVAPLGRFLPKLRFPSTTLYRCHC